MTFNDNHEQVNHPSHYQNIKISDQNYEVLDIAHGILNYLGLPPDITGDLFNVIKYLMRFPYKHPDNQKEDLQKAIFYAGSMTDNVKRHIVHQDYFQNDVTNELILTHHNQDEHTFEPSDIYQNIELMNLDDDFHQQIIPYIKEFYQTLLKTLLNVEDYGYGFDENQMVFNHLYMVYVDLMSILKSLMTEVFPNDN